MKSVNVKQNSGGWSEDHLFAKFAVAFTSALRYAHFPQSNSLYYHKLFANGLTNCKDFVFPMYS